MEERKRVCKCLTIEMAARILADTNKRPCVPAVVSHVVTQLKCGGKRLTDCGLSFKPQACGFSFFFSEKRDMVMLLRFSKTRRCREWQLLSIVIIFCHCFNSV